jgi:chemotaxis protein MotA
MTRSNFIIVALCLLIFASVFFLTGQAGAFLNIEAFLVVISGTFGATLLSFPWGQVKNAFMVVKNSYRTKVTSPDEIIHILLDLSVRSRLDGLPALEKEGEKTTMFFLRDALNMLADNYSEEHLREILNQEIFFFKLRRKNIERVFRVMAVYSPAFGLAGSVIGLIGLLYGIGDTGEVLKYIPIALISTLYGILFGNFIWAPMAEIIKDRTEREILTQKMIIDASAAIKTETNPYILERKLTSFLTPAARRDAHEAFADIRKRYVNIARARREGQEPEPESEQS